MAGYLGSRPVIVQVDGYQREESESRYVNVSGDDFSGHLDFVDDAKARFGSSDELHIYTESSGSGHSYIQGDNIVIRSAAGTARLTVTSNDVDVSSGALKVGGTTVINSSREGTLQRLNVTAATGLSSLAVTTNAFTIGSTNDLNMAFDPNEIQARNNGAANDLLLQKNGGTLRIGGDAPTGRKVLLGDHTSTASGSPTSLSLGARHSDTAGEASSLKLPIWENLLNTADTSYKAMGLGVSGNQLDYVVTDTAYKHAFWIGGTKRVEFNSSQLNLDSKTVITSAASPALTVNSSSDSARMIIASTIGTATFSYLQLTTSSNGIGYLIKNVANSGNGLNNGSLYLWNSTSAGSGKIEFVPNQDITKRTTIEENGDMTVAGHISSPDYIKRRITNYSNSGSETYKVLKFNFGDNSGSGANNQWLYRLMGNGHIGSGSNIMFVYDLIVSRRTNYAAGSWTWKPMRMDFPPSSDKLFFWYKNETYRRDLYVVLPDAYASLIIYSGNEAPQGRFRKSSEVDITVASVNDSSYSSSLSLTGQITAHKISYTAE
jgi:hypothetical protein